MPFPFAPLSRSFHEVALPDGIGFEGLEGWNDQLWLLSGSRLFQHDRTSIVRELQLCPGAHQSRYGQYSLHRTPSGLVASVLDRNENLLVAHITPDLRVICRPLAWFPAGNLLLAVTTLPHSTVLPMPRDTRSFLGFAIPQPTDPVGSASFFAPSRSSIWLQVWPSDESPRLWTFRFDGKVWQLVSNPPVGIASDMWVDPTGAVWAINTTLVTFGKRPPGDRSSMSSLAKYSRAKWREVAVPHYFQPHWMTGTAADDVWFVGRRTVQQWDGKQWRYESFEDDLQTFTPGRAVFAARPYMDSAGSLWILGLDPRDNKQKLYRTDPRPPGAPRGKAPG